MQYDIRESPSHLVQEEIDDLDYPMTEPPQVIYSGQDFDVEGLVRRLDRGDIIIPRFGETNDDIETAGYQRGFVWTKSQMDRFVESLLLGFPVPGIFLVKQSDKRMLVLDGQQRLTTLQMFYNGIYKERKFRLEKVADEFKGMSYDDLAASLRRELDNTYIQATIVTAQPDADQLSAIYQIFERLNSGGTRLTAHEIRIALYAGPIVDYLEQLNLDGAWRHLYGSKNLRVRDQELITRILALFVNSDNYSKPLKSFLNTFMEENSPLINAETRDAGTLTAPDGFRTREAKPETPTAGK